MLTTTLSPLRTAKQQLRNKMRQSLAAMPQEQRRQESEILVKKLLASDEYLCSRRVSVYISMPNEVQTQGVLKDIFTSGRACYIPWYDYHSTRMEMLRVNCMEDIDSLPVTKWNIKQPEDPDSSENALNTGGLDLIVSPGLGFTKEGHRIGQGKGYYDTYLARCRSLGFSPKTIAMAYSCMHCETIPMAEHDTPIDKMIFT